MEKLIVVKKTQKNNPVTWKPVMLKTDTYEKVNSLSKDLNISKGELATKMIEYALKNIEVKEVEEE